MVYSILFAAPRWAIGKVLESSVRFRTPLGFETLERVRGVTNQPPSYRQWCIPGKKGMENRFTASIIIVGDEVLKGQTKDTNSHFLCQELYKCGIKVSHISVIPDNIDSIAEEVLLHSNKYTYVLTSGGIGPTHDDVTYAGIAKAFQETLEINKELYDLLKNLFTNQGFDEDALRKMSHIPESSKVHPTRNSRNYNFLPIVSVKNVFIFPGIPSYLRCSFLYLKSLFCTNSHFYHVTLYINTVESNITKALNKAVGQYGDKVRFGSYPDLESSQYQVKLTLEADSEIVLEQAEAYLRSFLPHNTIVSPLNPKSEEALEEILKICNQTKCDFSEVVKESVAILDNCLKQYTPESICLSFNGGKDCTALLHLTRCILHKTRRSKPLKLKVLYVRSSEPFPDIEEFIQQSVDRYKLDIITYEYPIRNALRQLQNDHPEVKAILMGTRHTDPHASELQPHQMTDGDWPQFMRVSPMLHWSYQHVWNFLRHLNIPYCSLYDRGYTSLGCRNNTVPNPKLEATTDDGEVFYLPAYLLKEPSEEREGRTCKK